MSYNTFAGFYDELTDDISYPRRAAYFDRIIQKFHPGASILLDLACGTGSLSIELARLGYDVVGTDASQQMLSEAMLKKEIALYGENFEREEPSDPSIAKLLFLCQPMQELDMYGTLDAAVCALDSLNYLTRPDDCRKTLRRVYNALKSGGLFVFDINTPTKLSGLDGQVFLDETDDTYCVWRTEFDAKKRLCFYGMDIFRLNGSLWDRSFEEHIEYAYEPDELALWLEEAGFTHIRQYGDRVLRAPKQDEQRIYFSAKKD